MSTIKGKVIRVGDVQTINDKFKKREIVIATLTEYPQTIPVEFVNDRSDMITISDVGKTVTIHYDLRGREWKSPRGEVKFFNSLDVWSVQRSAGAGAGFDDPPLPDGPPPGMEDEIPF